MVDLASHLVSASEMFFEEWPDDEDAAAMAERGIQTRPPRAEAIASQLTPRMQALFRQMQAETLDPCRALPRRRFESFGGQECYRLDVALNVCPEAFGGWRRIERATWLVDIQCRPAAGLLHPLWVSCCMMWEVPEDLVDGASLEHGKPAGGVRAERWLHHFGLRPFAGAPVDACEPWQPTIYVEVEVDGVLMALPVDEKERPDP